MHKHNNKRKAVMGVKKKSGKAPKGQNLLAAIVAQVEELGRKHMGGILDFVEQAEDKKEKVTFGVEIDCSESEPNVTVSIRYSQSVTDRRSVVLDDPDQGTFKEVVEVAEGETKKRRKKNAEAIGAGECEPPATE